MPLERRNLLTPMSLAALVCLVAATLPAAAEHTRFWRQSTYDEFEKGSPKGVALRSDGRIVLAPRFVAFADPNTAYLWSLRMDSKGRLYAAGGSNAKVLRLDEKGSASTVFEAQEMTAQAITFDARDNLYVATSPDGKVYRVTPQGERSVFFEPKTKYIWDLAFDSAGTLFVATGDKGEIFAVSADGKGRLFYKSEETHVRSLALDHEGRLIAGTEPNGLVLRIDSHAAEATGKPPEPRAFVIYETSKKEVTALLIGKDGNLYVAAVGEKSQVNPVAVSPTPPVFPMVPGQPIPPQVALPPTVFLPFPPIGGGSEVYKISPDGAPERLWGSREDLVFTLALSPAGKLLLGTGNKGVVYELESNNVFSSLAKTFAAQATSLAAGPDGKVYVGTANPGKVFALGPDPEPEGVFESQVYDARIFSRWGRLTWWGEDGSTNGQVAFYLRSGNTSSPEKNWSPWAGPYKNPQGEVVDVPSARFVQWKAVFKGSSAGSNISWVSVAYLPKNVAPTIESIILQSPGIRVQGMSGPPPGGQVPQPVQLRLPPPPAPPGAPIVPQPPQPPAFGGQPRFEPPPQGFAQRGYQSVVWSARDDNDDELVFTLYYRGESEKSWKLLKDRVETKFYSWETTTMPDGAYYLKIVASDAPSNPPEDALTAERISDRFEVDNTPPVIENLSAEAASADARIRFEARNIGSVILRAEYSLDGGDWKMVFPVGRLSDAPETRYDFMLRALPAGEHTLTARVYDQFDNVTVAKVTFTVPPPKTGKR